MEIQKGVIAIIEKNGKLLMGKKKHTLVVGGTGMLRDVSLELAKQGYIVSVIARDGAQLNTLAEQASSYAGKIVPLTVDYQDSLRLSTAIQDAVRNHGEFSLAVIWIHSIAANALTIVAKHLEDQKIKCAFFHILGSSNLAELSEKKSYYFREFQAFRNVEYYQIILGQIKENSTSRWLTNSEISTGVLEAITKPTKHSIVGQIDY